LNNDDALELQARFRNIDAGNILNMNPPDATRFAGSREREGHAMQWVSRFTYKAALHFMAARVMDVAPGRGERGAR
jgi:hypothetical protein